ncbi:SH3 domain-containing protein [Nakamurella lactea]|jgi:hypothetical protein|uniref:hypothetical protein n=1 Tax=Nakamurella lactea TaxID=459515 RepID=UPI0003FCC648|nr:hypothetical protein [Nakamurella lactea]
MGTRFNSAAKTLTAFVFAAGIVTAGAGAASAAPAMAGPSGSVGPNVLDCSVSHPNKDAGSGHPTTSVNVRSGPHTGCDANWWAGKSTKLYYHCWVSGTKVGNYYSWTHVRIAGTNRQGWVSDYYLNDHGATHHC